MNIPKATGFFDKDGKPCEADAPERVVTEWKGRLRTRNDGKPAEMLTDGKWISAEVARG